MTDNRGCTKEETYEILDGTGVSFTTQIIQNPSCLCCADGIFQLQINGGIGSSYDIHVSTEISGWEYITTISSSTAQITGAGFGQNIISVIDNTTGCRLFEEMYINPPDPIAIELESITHMHGSGNGFSQGAIDISVSNGQVPYQYQWSCGSACGDISWSTSPDGQDISEIIYTGGYQGSRPYVFTVTVTDADGCTEEAAFNVFLGPEILQCATNINQGYVGQITPCIPNVGGGQIKAPAIINGEPPYSYLWTYPDGTTATTQNISNLTLEGTYSVLITDAAYQECGRDFWLKCECDNFRGIIDYDDCDRNDPGWVEVTGISYATTNPYYVLFSTGDNAVVWVDANGGIIFHYGTLRVNNIQVPDGYNSTQVCVIIADPYGCKDYQCRTIYKGNQCTYSIKDEILDEDGPLTADPFQNNHAYTQIFGQLNAEFGFQEGDYIAKCYMIESCEDEASYGPLIYEPNDMNNPCSGGGQLYCRLCPDQPLGGMEVPPNYGGIPLQYEGSCLCLWPPGIISDQEFIDAGLEGNIQDFWIHPVVAFYDCNGNSNGNEDPTIDPVGPNCDQFEACQENCTYDTNLETCEYDLTCREFTASVPAQSWYCFNNQDCSIYLECSINPCIKQLVDFCEEGCLLTDLISYFGDSPEFYQCLGSENEPLDNCDCTDLGGISFDIFIGEIAPEVLPECHTCEDDPSFPDIPIIPFPDTSISSSRNWSGNDYKTQNLVVEGKREDRMVKVFPNPFNNKLTLSIEAISEESIYILLTDVLGKTRYESKKSLLAGLNIIDMKPYSGIAPGVYELVIITSRGYYFRERLVKTYN